MNLTEAWKEFGCKYAGPNLEAKFKEVVIAYAKEKCQQMKEICADEASEAFNNLKEDDFIFEDGEYLFDRISMLDLPDFE